MVRWRQNTNHPISVFDTTCESPSRLIAPMECGLARAISEWARVWQCVHPSCTTRNENDDQVKQRSGEKQRRGEVEEEEEKHEKWKLCAMNVQLNYYDRFNYLASRKRFASCANKRMNNTMKSKKCKTFDFHNNNNNNVRDVHFPHACHVQQIVHCSRARTPPFMRLMATKWSTNSTQNKCDSTIKFMSRLCTYIFCIFRFVFFLI